MILSQTMCDTWSRKKYKCDTSSWITHCVRRDVSDEFEMASAIPTIYTLGS